MSDYTTLKKQRLILLRGHLDAVYGTYLDDVPPLGETTISLHDVSTLRVLSSRARHRPI